MTAHPHYETPFQCRHNAASLDAQIAQTAAEVKAGAVSPYVAASYLRALGAFEAEIQEAVYSA